MAILFTDKSIALPSLTSTKSPPTYNCALLLSYVNVLHCDFKPLFDESSDAPNFPHRLVDTFQYAT